MNMKIQDTKMSIPRLDYTEELPNMNNGNNFIVLSKAEEQSKFVHDWLTLVNYEIIIKDNLKNKTLNRDIKAFKNHEKTVFEFADYTKQIFMLSHPYQAIGLKQQNFNTFAYEKYMNYKDLTNLLLQEEQIKLKGYSIKHLIDRFFIKKWCDGELLYPLFLKNKKRMQRKIDWESFIFAFKNDVLIDFYHYSINRNPVMFKASMNILLTVKPDYFLKITNEDILYLKERITEASVNKAQKSHYINALNFIVMYLIQEKGRTDLKTPNELTYELYKKSKTSILMKTLDNFVVLCPSFYAFKTQIPEFLLMLEKGSNLSKASLEQKKTYLKIFLEYMRKYYCDCKPTEETFKKVINLLKEDSFNSYLENKYKRNAKTYITILHTVGEFLVYFNYLNAEYVKKHTPVTPGSFSLSNRQAISKRMMRDLVEILLTRPPNYPVKYDKTKADLSWWKFEVFPTLPLMLLLHLFIPLRGEQIRNLCRRKSFVLDERGRIVKLVVNTDKNVNRKEYQEIPFEAFKSLQIFNDYLRWHKEYFPHLPLHTYKDDKNSPWKKIEPVFCLPKLLKPVDKRVHMNYLKRLFVQYRIELEQEGYAPEFVYLTPEGKNILGKEFFESVDELNKTTNTFIQKHVKIIYDIHTFRITGVTRYLEAGMPINVVMMLTGHQSPNIMLRVYNRLTYEEKLKILRSSSGVYLGEGENVKANTKKVIEEEFVNAFKTKGVKGVKECFESNNMFIVTQNDTSKLKNKDKILEEVLKIHPTSWIPMPGGICPGVKCPEGKEKKCSLCSYFITGKIFLDGIIYRTNLSTLKFLQKVEETQKSDDEKPDDLQVLLEEMYGWFNLLQRVESQVTENGNSTKDKNNMLVAGDKREIVGKEQIPTVQGYLEHVYEAKMLNEVPDMYASKILTIKAYQLALKEKDSKALEIVNDEAKAVDYIMSYYEYFKRENKLLDFVRKLEFKG